MSYILEALKKADNKRKLGDVPDLHSDHEQELGDETKRALWPYVIAALLFCNAALIGWWIAPWQNKMPEEKTMLEVSGEPQTEQAVKADQPKTESDRLKPDNPVDVSVPEPPKESVKLEPAPPAMVEGDNLPQLSRQTLEQEEVEVVDKGPRGPMAAPRIVEQSLASGTEKIAIEDSVEEPGSEGSLQQTFDSANPETLAPEDETEELAAPDLLDGEDTEEERPDVQEFRAFDLAKVPYIYQLPVSIQNKLPEIKISFHSYTHRPATRVVRINGHIKREGQSIEKGIILEKIIPKGVVLMYEKRLFRLDV